MAGIPARPPIKPTGRESAKPFNESGIFAGASTGSGTAKYQPKPKVPKGPREQASYNLQAKKSGTFQGGPTGSGVVKDQFVGEGADKRYVQVPEPVKGSGGPVPPSVGQAKRNAAAAGIDAGTSRNAPKKRGQAPKPAEEPVKDTDTARPAPGEKKGEPTKPKEDEAPKGDDTTSSSSSSSSSDKADKSAPAVPGTLNYFMKMTMKDGKKNSRNRAYQMFKNYKKSGKLPGDMGSATQ